MATFDITVPAGSGVGNADTASSAFTEPGDFDGATIDDVSVVGTPTITSDGITDDEVGVRWRIQTDGGVAIWGDYGSDAVSLCSAVLGDSVSSDTITDGSAPSPNPATAVAADWDEIAYEANYNASGMPDAETCSWSAFTIRVTYTPSTAQEITAAGGIATGEAVPTDATLALAVRQSITGTVGEIASLEVVPTDAVIANVVQTIGIGTGSIPSGEAVPTDAQVAAPSQDIIQTVGLPSLEAVPTDAVVVLSTRQTITGITSIPTAEAIPTDALFKTGQDIIQVTSIPSAEGVPSSLTVGAVVLDNPAAYFSHGTTVDINGAVHAVSVVASFGGGVGDAFLAGTRHTVNGAMYVTFDAPVGGDFYINGLLHTTTGIRYVINAIALNKWPEGFSADNTGEGGTTTILGGFYIRGIKRNIDGRMVIDL